MEVLKLTSSLNSPVDHRLRLIADTLLLKGSFTDNPGLLNGKMGIAIFMYNYARKTAKEIYKNYAEQLIDEIYEVIKPQIQVDFAKGLTGIGWGIEYLVRNSYVEAETDETLVEIDNAIYKNMIQQPVLTYDGTDLFGYGFYYLARLQGRENADDNLNTLIKKQILTYR
jgi:hypothetical protein